MVIKILSIGNKLRSWENDSIAYYLKQLPKTIGISFIDVRGLQNPKISKYETINKESMLLMEKIAKDDYVISCDQDGKQCNSINFANLIKRNMELNQSISFIIGGSYGLSDKIKKNSNMTLSMSSLTFPHKLFKLILVEQIYRAHTIIAKMPYHK